MKEVHRHYSFSVFNQAEPENVADGSSDREHWPQPIAADEEDGL
jgi:hypothetical protein